jgi:NAD(P)-dependent dehydrogenase (short-subunit alcohol dehydrogenase family)
MKRLQDLVALITGAAGGLGRATALRFAREGARLCLADRAPAQDLLEQIKAEGGHAIAVMADVTDPSSVEAMVASALREFGGVDILVNIAGISSHGASDDVDMATFEHVLRTNLTSVFLCCKAVLPNMRERRYGRIVNMSSILGKNGGNPRPWIDPKEQKRAGNLAYGASKAGVHALTFYLAKENAHHGITVNSIPPGRIMSEQIRRKYPPEFRAEQSAREIPVGRYGEPEELAALAVFLSSPLAAYITGTVMPVDGGLRRYAF